uniref:Uncharacterized protein n=1 Tax=Arundo donax TaxID=35708 RepID=A0A0A8ZW06_ARUDO
MMQVHFFRSTYYPTIWK